MSAGQRVQVPVRHRPLQFRITGFIDTLKGRTEVRPFRLSKKVTLNVEVYESALHQRLPCVKGAVILHLLKCKMTEGLCGAIKHIRTGIRRIRNIHLRQPLSQNRLSGAGFASSPYTGEP